MFSESYVKMQRLKTQCRPLDGVAWALTFKNIMFGLFFFQKTGAFNGAGIRI